jgi:hypothetical protein
MLDGSVNVSCQPSIPDVCQRPAKKHANMHAKIEHSENEREERND